MIGLHAQMPCVCAVVPAMPRVQHRCGARAGSLQGHGQECAPAFPHPPWWSGYWENWKIQLSRLQSLR